MNLAIFISSNSTKPPGARNSRHEGLQMNNEHSNELLDYCQHSTPQFVLFSTFQSIIKSFILVPKVVVHQFLVPK